MRRWQWTAALALVALAGGLSARVKAEPKPQAKLALTPGTDTLKGRVTLEGDMPPIDKLNAEVNRVIGREEDRTHCLCEKAGTDREQQFWRINKQNKGVANVVVFLVPEKATFFACGPDDAAVKAVKDKALELRQPYCAFHPHVSVHFPVYRTAKNEAVKTGQKITIYNDTDKAPGGKPGGITHNTKWAGSDRQSSGNVTIAPGKTHEIPDAIPDREPIQFACSIHRWMNAYVWVLDHPYFAVTDANGEFEIKNVGAGKVRIVAWHEAAVGNYLNEDRSWGEPIELKMGVTIKNFALKAK